MYAIYAMLLTIFIMIPAEAFAGVSIGPYYSLRSTKKISTNRNDRSQEDTVNKTREEGGIRALVTMGKLFRAEFSAGQSALTVTEKTRNAVDEFSEINYIEDLNMNTDDPDRDVKTTDTITNARFGLIIDPSISIFVLRTKLGVQATHRKMTMHQTGFDKTTTETPITYKPYAGAGVGIRFSSRQFFMVEYQGFFYKFPDLEPFQREVTVSYNLQIGGK